MFISLGVFANALIAISIPTNYTEASLKLTI